VCAATVARAQPDGADVAAAARAYEEGMRAQLRRDYAQAASLFELADRSAPSAAALRSAIRNHEAAGNVARALTLAVRADRRYPTAADTHKAADSVLARLAPSCAAVTVRCSPGCAVLVDGRVAAETASEHELYLAPGEHALVASWGEGRSLDRAVQAS